MLCAYNTIFYLFLKNIYLFDWPVLSCGMWDLVPRQGSNLGPLHWEHRVLATGPPRKSHHILFIIYTGKVAEMATLTLLINFN